MIDNLSNDEANELIEEAILFCKTLKGKSLAEKIGQLMLAFNGMDIISAKAIVIISEK